MLRRTISAIATVFTLIFVATFSPIVQNVNRRRRKNAPETRSDTDHQPYKIPRKELENPKGFDDYSFNKIIRDNFAGNAAPERENRSREEDEEIDEILKGIASLMNEERSRMYRSFLDEELMSREGNEDAFFNHHYITPRITESKIVTRNINVRGRFFHAARCFFSLHGWTKARNCRKIILVMLIKNAYFLITTFGFIAAFVALITSIINKDKAVAKIIAIVSGIYLAYIPLLFILVNNLHLSIGLEILFVLAANVVAAIIYIIAIGISYNYRRYPCSPTSNYYVICLSVEFYRH